MSQAQAAQAFVDALLEDDPVALYDKAPCGYLSTTPDGVVVKANSTLRTWTGYEDSDLVGSRLTDLLTPGGRIYHETHYAPMLRMQGSVRELAVDIVRKDGSRLPVLLNATLDRDADRRPRVVRVAVFDATERRRYERELLRATEAAQEARREADRARAVAEEAEHRSRALVDTLQDTLVPHSLPTVAGLRLAGVYRPAGDGREVGGDFYDAFPTEPDECWLVLGDVSGKGIGAAVVTGLVRNGARALTLSLPPDGREPAEVLARLNQLLVHHETSRFCTVAVVRMRRSVSGWEVSYGSGGHVPGVLQLGERVQQVETSGLILGAFPDAWFEQKQFRMAPRDTLLLCTDGVTEARCEGELYGEERLHRAVAEAPRDPEKLASAVLAEVLDFQRDRPRDDIACLAVQVT